MERKEGLKHDTDLDSLVSKRKPFGYDLKHAMENIRDHYTIPLEEAMVLENMDNCIEEPYQEIRFNIERNVLEEEFLVHGVIMMQILFSGGTTTRAIQVEKMREAKVNPSLVPYSIDQSGIEIYPNMPLFGES